MAAVRPHTIFRYPVICVLEQAAARLNEHLGKKHGTETAQPICDVHLNPLVYAASCPQPASTTFR
jgi:hypothetical protein